MLPAAWVGLAVAALPAFRPLSEDALYRTELRFARGVPRLSLGLAEERPSVELRSDALGRVFFEQDGLPRAVLVPSGATVRVEPRRLVPGRRAWWATAPVLEGVPPPRPNPRRVRTGGLFAVGEAVVDTRREVWRAGPFDSAEAATEAAPGAAPMATVLRRPRGVLTVRVDGEVIGRAEGPVALQPAPGAAWRFDDRSVDAPLYALPGMSAGLDLVASLDAETLLRGLVPAETFASAPPAALEAQAVVARSAMLSMLGHRHFDAPFHLCARQHCQVYAGAQTAQPSTDAAVAATRGRVVVGGTGDLVETVYSASCGGHTEANEVVWARQASPYLRPRLDGSSADPALAPFADGIHAGNVDAWVEVAPPTYCARASLTRPERFRWTRVLDRAALDALGERLGLGGITALRVLGRGRGGRVTGVALEGPGGRREVLRELPVRRLLGGLRSGAFVVRPQRGPDGALEQVELLGGGFGHGVGLCQMGAIGRAEAGQTATEILEFYYSGARVVRLY